MINKITTFISRYRDAISYIITGGLTTLVNLVVFTVLCELLSVDITVSNIISVAAAILFAYVTNKIFVFRSKCPDMRSLAGEFARFVSARLITMVIEVGGVFLLVNIMGMQPLVGKLLTQIIVVIGNYFISKFLVFVHKKDSH